MNYLTKEVEWVIEELNNDGVILYPTDTVYGLGCKIDNIGGIKRIHNIKGRDPSKPLSIAFYDIEQLEQYADISKPEKRIISEKLIEGPYTFIVNKREGKINELISKDGAVGVRIPDHYMVKMICKEAGPIITTSANLSGAEAAVRLDDVVEEIIKKVDIILIGECKYERPSTILDIRSLKILRE